jgi:transcriptional regulator with XRE-family HTH domain
MKYPNIEAERIKRGITKEEFAAEIGVTKRTVRNWQSGDTELPVSKLLRICNILGCRSDYLLGLEEVRS